MSSTKCQYCENIIYEEGRTVCAWCKLRLEFAEQERKVYLLDKKQRAENCKMGGKK